MKCSLKCSNEHLDGEPVARSMRSVNAKPLPCPFCGTEAVCKWDGPEAKPFFVRCERVGCPAYNSTQTFAEGDVALARWNQRVQMPPVSPERVAHLGGFAVK